MSRLNVANFRHPDGTADNITLDSSTNATVAGNLTASGNSTVTGNLTVNGTGNQSIAGTLQFNSGYGSVATSFGVRAWITFNGGASTIGTGRANGNMDAVTDNGNGDYTLNFTTDMPDANYCVLATIANTSDGYSNIVSDSTRAAGTVVVHGTTAPTTGAVRLSEAYGSNANNNGGATNFETFVAIIR